MSQAHLVIPIRMKCGPKHYSIHRRMRKAFSQSLSTSSKNLSKQPTFTQQQQKNPQSIRGTFIDIFLKLIVSNGKILQLGLQTKYQTNLLSTQKKKASNQNQASHLLYPGLGSSHMQKRQIKTLGLFCSVCSLTSTSRPYSQIYIHLAK